MSNANTTTTGAVVNNDISVHSGNTSAPETLANSDANDENTTTSIMFEA